MWKQQICSILRRLRIPNNTCILEGKWMNVCPAAKHLHRQNQTIISTDDDDDDDGENYVTKIKSFVLHAL